MKNLIIIMTIGILTACQTEHEFYLDRGCIKPLFHNEIITEKEIKECEEKTNHKEKIRETWLFKPSKNNKKGERNDYQ